jgi:hypothetical protein
MPWSAIDALDDARRATTDLLLPFDRGRWLRLAIIAFFIGGVGSGFQGGSNVGGGGGGGTPGTPGPDFRFFDLPVDLPAVGAVAALVVGIVGLILLFVLVSMFVGSVLEFVLVEGVRDREIHIREPFRRYLGKGTSLFVFRLLVGLAVFAVIAIPIALLILGGTAGGPGALVLLVFPLILVAVVAGLTAALVDLLTRDLVVPAMFAEDRGVVGGWRRIWGVLRREWKQVGVYVLARVVLALAAGIAVGIVVTLAALVVAVPFVIVGGGLYLLLVGLGPGGIGLGGGIVLGLLALLFVLTVFVLTAFVQVPVVTYFRYYSLFVLGDLEPDLDVLSDLRKDEWDESAQSEGDDGDGESSTTA